MEACIILSGESFRLGGQNNRNRDSDESYNEQINAAKSHVSFIKDLNNRGINVDVYISTYETKFKNDLIKIYKDNLIHCDFYPDLIGQHALIHNAINKIQNIEKYNFLLNIRIDLFLKSRFLELFDQNWDKIMWPSICFKPYHKHKLHPRVNHIITYIPKKYYKFIQDFHWDLCHGVTGHEHCHGVTGHAQWYHLITNTDLKYDNLDTMLNTFHDADSAKDFNPLYYIVNRPQLNIHHDKGDIFDKWEFLRVADTQ